MNLEEKISYLKSVNIFSETEDRILSLIADATDEISVRKGKIIFRKDDPGDAMYVILKGEVRIHDGSHVLARLKDGQVFGEYALIDQESRSATVTADDACSLLRLDQQEFYDVAVGNPGVLRGVLKVLTRRMRDKNELEEKLSKSYLKIRSQKEKIEKQNENIQQQKEILEQQNFDLTRLNEEKNELISILVHQIKNPLTSSLCLTEMLEDPETEMDAKTQAESFKVIRQSLRRISNLVNEVLDLDAIDSKVFELKFQKINPDQIIQELVENYNYLLEQKNIKIELDLSIGELNLNKVYFTQIVDNLLSNAIKVSEPTHSVKITYQIEEKYAILKVCDEGPGIPIDKLNELFNKYSRQTSMNLQDDAQQGLGLAIIQKYTTAMNGNVDVETKEGKGTTFIIKFPLD